MNVADGLIVKEYRETPTSSWWFVTRGPEVVSVMPQSMLYASDETLHLGFRDDRYRTAFFTFAGGSLTPTFVQVFQSTTNVADKYIHSIQFRDANVDENILYMGGMFIEGNLSLIKHRVSDNTRLLTLG